jgi:hypothetical protein
MALFSSVVATDLPGQASKRSVQTKHKSTPKRPI